MYFKNNKLLTIKIPASVMGQINCVVDHFTTEVSWYGDVTKEGDVITINKIYLFPQVVTGGTFRTDTPQISEIYDAWYENKLNEVADHYDQTGESIAIMQYNGHSHVSAPCAPSSEDTKFRRSREGLNIYSIHNKQNGMSWEVWTDDMVYEYTDIDIVYVDDIFLDSKEFVLKPAAVVPVYQRTASAGYNNTPGHQRVSRLSNPATKAKQQQLLNRAALMKAEFEQEEEEKDKLSDQELEMQLLDEAYQEALASGTIV